MRQSCSTPVVVVSVLLFIAPVVSFGDDLEKLASLPPGQWREYWNDGYDIPAGENEHDFLVRNSHISMRLCDERSGGDTAVFANLQLIAELLEEDFNL